MARKKTTPLRVETKAALGSRLREIRIEVVGCRGGPEMARRLNLPARTWYNYESGVTVPAEVVLGFLIETGVNPAWLLNAERPRYCRAAPGATARASSLIAALRGTLDLLERESRHGDGGWHEAGDETAPIPCDGRDLRR